MKAQILNGEILTRVLPAKDGKPSLTFRSQKAAIVRPGDFPLPFAIPLEEGQQPYGPGEYDVCPSSLEQDKYDGLKFGRKIKLLTPAPAPGPASK